jgi:hypothetical protein
MAKGLGNNYRLWIESATPGTFNEILGNQDLAVARNGQTIDTSGKSDFPYATNAPGLRSVNITASFVPNLPDANGYTRLETQANATAATPFNIQIRKGGSAGVAPADVVFECSVYCTDFGTDFAQNGALKATCTLVAAAAPTTDALAV